MVKKNFLKSSLIIALVAIMLIATLAVMSTTTLAASDNNWTARAHAQTFGWLDEVTSIPVVAELPKVVNKTDALTNAVIGTTGKSKRLEAIDINVPEGVTLQYRAHVQSFGWQEWKTADNNLIAKDARAVDNSAVGTMNLAKRIEAVQIAASGLGNYDLYYRAQSQTFGWGPWVKALDAAVTTNPTKDTANANYAGTMDQSKRLEAIEMVLVERHDYDEPVFEWDEDETGKTTVKATVECKDCGFEKELDVTCKGPIYYTDEEPTCLRSGTGYLEATTTYAGKEYKETREVTVPALGHTYTKVTQNADGKFSATCTRCKSDETFEYIGGALDAVKNSRNKTLEVNYSCVAQGAITIPKDVTVVVSGETGAINSNSTGLTITVEGKLLVKEKGSLSNTSTNKVIVKVVKDGVFEDTTEDAIDLSQAVVETSKESINAYLNAKPEAYKDGTLYGKTIDALQKDVTISEDGKVSGTLYYVGDYSTAFGAQGKGYFLTLHLEKGEAAKIKAGKPGTLDSKQPLADGDEILVYWIKNHATVEQIGNLEIQYLDSEGNIIMARELDLSGLTLVSEMNSLKDGIKDVQALANDLGTLNVTMKTDGWTDVKASDLQKSVTITPTVENNQEKLVVTGELIKRNSFVQYGAKDGGTSGGYYVVLNFQNERANRITYSRTAGALGDVVSEKGNDNNLLLVTKVYDEEGKRVGSDEITIKYYMDDSVVTQVYKLGDFVKAEY